MYDPFEGEMNQYFNDPEGSMERDLVKALDTGVQQPVNKALVWALGPVTRHLRGCASQQEWIPVPPC